MPEAARGEAGTDTGIKLTDVGNLTTLVADIASRGSRPARAKQA
jgi:DNA repair protein RadA/Sms